jgi:hypothetical protein
MPELTYASAVRLISLRGSTDDLGRQNLDLDIGSLGCSTENT